MIQRVQSVFLFLSGAASFATLFLPIWVKQNSGTGMKARLDAFELAHITNGEVVTSQTTIHIAIILLLSSILAFGALFSFKNLMRQVQLNLLNIMLLMGALGFSVYYILYVGEKFFDADKQGAFGYGFYLPLAALIFNNLANRFIRKDHDLLKSVDRLR